MEREAFCLQLQTGPFLLLYLLLYHHGPFKTILSEQLYPYNFLLCLNEHARWIRTRGEREKERESGTNNNPRATVPHIPPCSASRSHKWTPTRSSTDETYGSHLRGGGTEKRKEKQMGGGRRETAAPDLPPCAPTVGALLSYVYVCNRVETPCTLVR